VERSAVSSSGSHEHSLALISFRPECFLAV